MAATKQVKRGRKKSDSAMNKRLPGIRVTSAEKAQLEAEASAGGRNVTMQIRWKLFPPAA